MPVSINLDKLATRESVKELVRSEIFEVGLCPDYNPDHLRLVEAICLHYAMENEQMAGDPIAGDPDNQYSLGFVLDTGLTFRMGLEVGISLARGDRKAFPSALKRALKQLKD